MDTGPRIGDAFGLALLDYLEHGDDGASHFIERDDGRLEALAVGAFVSGDSMWSGQERAVGERCGRRVLDVGAGGGRHALPLQEAGHDVVALDVSPGAVEVCRRRGVEATYAGTVFEFVDTGPSQFDTFLLCGNNLGLLESRARAPEFLRALAGLAAPGAEILGTGIDPFDTDDALHLAYHERNRRRGRLAGQLRLRSRWADLATPWFDYLFVPIDTLEELTTGTGWKLVAHEPGHPYFAALRYERG